MRHFGGWGRLCADEQRALLTFYYRLSADIGAATKSAGKSKSCDAFQLRRLFVYVTILPYFMNQ
jgi:hypothetical protein